MPLTLYPRRITKAFQIFFWLHIAPLIKCGGISKQYVKKYTLRKYETKELFFMSYFFELLHFYCKWAICLTKMTAMRNNEDVPGKFLAVWSQSVSDVSAVNPSVAFSNIHRRMGEALFFSSVPDTSRYIPPASKNIISHFCKLYRRGFKKKFRKF
jgi:hypothetical protein